jgi:hypothetical protein
VAETRYTQWTDGDWLEVPSGGIRFMCCGCSLTHLLEVKVVVKGGKRKIFMRATRNDRATSAARRAKARTIVVET